MKRSSALLCATLVGCASFTSPLSPSTVQTIINDATMTLGFADTAAAVYESLPPPAGNPAIQAALVIAGKQAHAALTAVEAAQACVPNATVVPPVVCSPITPSSLVLTAFQAAVTGYFSSVLAVVPNLPPLAKAKLGAQYPQYYPWTK